MKHILVVEDEMDIQELLENFLIDAGYQVTLASDGVEGIAAFRSGEFDLILLDIMLPKIDGYGVCEVIRQESEVPIMMLTALDSETDQLKGFDLRIDDYVTKPFSMAILLRKIEAVLRRTQKQEEKEGKIQYRELTLNIDSRQIYQNGQLIETTFREFELLRELLQNSGRVMTRQMLLDQVWDYNYYGDERIVDTHIKNLRKKLGAGYIETVRGVGYRVDKEN
jgi:two-component system response regulator VanR